MSEESENLNGTNRRPRWPIAIGGLLLLTCSIAAAVYWLNPRVSDEEYRQRCDALSDQEDWSNLEILAVEWESATENPGEAIMFQADACLQQGRVQEAVDSLLRVPARSALSFEALIIACDLQFDNLNKPLDGVKTLQMMIQQRPSSVTSRKRLIFFYAITLQQRELLNEIRNAIANQSEPPDAYSYLLMADHLSFSNGFAKNSEWLKGEPESELFKVARTIQLLDNLELSDNANARTNLPSVRAQFEELRKTYPANTALLRTALEYAVRDFDIDRVETLVAQIPEDTQDSVLLRMKGWLSYQQEDFETAKQHLEASIFANRMDWHTWHELAACHRRLGNSDAAKHASEIALEGKAIRKEIMQLKDASVIEDPLLQRLAKYARSCGEDQIYRIAMLRSGGRP